MHQNRWRLGLCPRPRWGSLQRSTRPPSCWWGREGEGEREGRGRGGDGRGREGRTNPLARILDPLLKPSTGIRTKIIEFSEIEGETSEIISDHVMG